MSRRTIKQALYSHLVVAKLRSNGTKFPSVAVPAQVGKNAFIGPTNTAGQGAAWARALERTDQEWTATSMAVPTQSDFGFTVDQRVVSGYAAHSRAWQRRQFAAVKRYDAVLLESGRPLFSTLFDADPTIEIRRLHQAGVTNLALVFHGSDIRDPDAHMAREEYSPYALDPTFTGALREGVRRNRALIAQSGLPVFVSTPGLMSEVEGAVWLPVVVDVDRWAAPERALVDDGPLRVAHVPSSSIMKGSEIAEPTLRALNEEGRIRFHSVRGVPHQQMPRMWRSSDVVVDQMRAGTYGVAACEAMAGGRLVISHIPDRMRQRTRELTGEDLPIVEATPATLRDVLHDVENRREHYAQVANRGPGFVRRHHDGTRSGRVLAAWTNSHAGVSSMKEQGR